MDVPKRIWLHEGEYVVELCAIPESDDDVEYVIATRATELERENERMRERIEELQRIAKIAQTIYTVASDKVDCPHGDSAKYPTSGWWCDDCFFELEAALRTASDE